MDYEKVIKEQINSMDLNEINEIFDDVSEESGLIDSMTTEEIIDKLISGKSLIDSEQFLERLLDLFLIEIRSAVFVGCQILAVCIVIGLLTNFSDSFGKKTVSSLGNMICSCVIIALCIGNFYQIYMYCQDTMDTMAYTMQILLPVMIPLLISMGGISSGGILSPVIIGAVTGFGFIVQHIILPLVFLSAMFVLINSITEKDYVKKLAVFLRRGAVFITGLCVTVFTGITAIQSIVTKSADGILINTTRFSLDNFIPIVGGFAADSLDMVISCVGLIKNAVGIIGVLIILLMLIIPVIKILAVAAVYKFIAIAAEPVSSSNISDSLNEMGTAAVTMTVILATGAFMFLIFITIIMGMGGGSIWT